MVLLLQSLFIVSSVILATTISTTTDSNVHAYSIHYQRLSSSTITTITSRYSRRRRSQQQELSLLRHGLPPTTWTPNVRIGPSLLSPSRVSSSTTAATGTTMKATMLQSKLGSDDDDVNDGITNNSNKNDQGNINDEDDDELVLLSADVRGRPAGVVLEDLDWRVMKLRLEEENTRRFLKAGPRFLPYDEARKWVQAWGQRWMTQSDWNSWIEKGEKRNSYIPSRPEEYYTKRGSWISWDHFLGVDNENDDDPNKEQSS